MSFSRLARPRFAMVVATAWSVTVSQAPKKTTTAPRPAHHANDTKSAFINPWPSWRTQRASHFTEAMWGAIAGAPKVDKDIHEKLNFQKPQFEVQSSQSQAIKATWLGHACFLVELPTPEGAVRGPRILFDPVFSKRCSPSQWVGPARYTEPPLDIKELPAVDIVVISHNHYDHLSEPCIRTLNDIHKPHFFAPLNNDAWFASVGIPNDRVHILDWWDDRTIKTNLQTSAETPEILTEYRITCTPCQHFTGRGILDRFKTLWASWVIEDLSSAKKPKIFFGGDTAYRSVHDGENEDDVPTCPAFKEIGEKFGGFDFAMIPIGAYMPRAFMSTIHCAPQDSVKLFQDIKAKRAIGMHWGTWILTTEPVLEPPQRLKEECEKAGIPEGVFTTCGLGETVVV